VPFAVLYSVWIVILMVIHRSHILPLDHGEPADGFVVILSYFFAAVCVGTVMGLLRPALRTATGAAVTGVIAAVPVAVGFRIGMEGFARWTSIDVYTIATFAVAMGVMGGLILWNIFSEPPAKTQ
jgi:hypothetical protein